MPLAGEEKTTLSDAPDPPSFGPSGKAWCTNTIQYLPRDSIVIHSPNYRGCKPLMQP